MLPELWSCGYDPATLAADARGDAEPIEGRGTDPGRRRPVPRDVPRRGERPRARRGRQLHDTALVFSPHGELAAWHRKAHLSSATYESAVFTAGERLTTFDDPALGRVGLVVGSDGDFPEVARVLALRGAHLVVAPCACEVERSSAWELLRARRWPWPTAAVGCSRPGRVPTRPPLCSAPAGSWRPTGAVVALSLPERGSRRAYPAELLVHRIDLQLAHRRDPGPAPGEEERRPDLYMELVDPVPTVGSRTTERL